MKRYTVASCFVAFMLPHVLFVRDYEERRKTTMCCCLGWNISIFPDAALREQHIEMVWKMVESDNQEPPPFGIEEGFKQDLRILIEQKRDLFPWLATNIPKAELTRHGNHDMLCIQAGNSDIEEIPLATHPDPLGLPRIIEVLRGIHRDTAEQAELMEQASRSPRVFSDIEKTQMATAYGIQRASLIGYRRMLMVWRDTQPAPSVKRVIGHWLGVLDEIEADTKAVLGILSSGK